MKRWSKRETLVALIVAVGFSLIVGLGVFAIKQYDKVSETQTSKETATHASEPAPIRDITADEIVAGVNAERVKAGLGALAVNQALNNSACMKADDMIAKKYFEHVAPDGKQPWYWFNAVGYSYAHAGENLGEGFTSATLQVSGWMNSEGHRANMLEPEYTEMGVCVKYSTDEATGVSRSIIVNHFATPR